MRVNTSDAYVHAHTDQGTKVVAPGQEFPDGEYLDNLDPALYDESEDEQLQAGVRTPGPGQRVAYDPAVDGDLDPVGEPAPPRSVGPNEPQYDPNKPLSRYNKAQLQAWLEQRSVSYDPDASRNQLAALAADRQKQEEASDGA